MRKEPFDRSRKVFVHSVPPGMDCLRIGGHQLHRADEVKWEEWGVEEKRIRMLWQYLYHSEALELEKYGKHGDGLDNMGVEELTAIVEDINKRLEEKYQGDDYEIKRRRCRFPQGGRDNPKRIIPKIREWRRTYGHEDEFFKDLEPAG